MHAHALCVFETHCIFVISQNTCVPFVVLNWICYEGIFFFPLSFRGRFAVKYYVLSLR